MLFDNVIEQIQASKKEEAEVVIVKLGEVTSVTPGGRAYVKLYGDGSPSTKLYTYIDGYFPEAGDKVALLPQGKTYIILGKVSEKDPIEIYAKIQWVKENFLGLEYKSIIEDASDANEKIRFENYALIPSSDNKDTLGGADNNFKEIFIKKLTLDGESFTKIYQDRIFVKDGNNIYSLIATYAAGTITLTPSTDNAWALGTSAKKLKEIWTGLFRGAWKSGQSTERQLSWNSSNALVPDTNESVDLGSSSLHFKDLYIRRVIGAFAHDNTNGYISWTSATVLAPSATDSIELGAAAKQFNKIYTKSIFLNGTEFLPANITVDKLHTTYGQQSKDLTLSADANGVHILPNVNNQFKLGSASYKFAEIFATKFTGDLTGNVTGDVTGKYKDGNSYYLSFDSSHNLIPDTNNVVGLGSLSYKYKDVYATNLHGLFDGSWKDGNYSLGFDSSHNLVPSVNEGQSLGTAAKQFAKVYAKEIYLNGTAIDISGISTDKLVATSGTATRELTLSVSGSGALLLPSVDDAFYLGGTNHKFKEVYASYLNGILDGSIKVGNYTLSIDDSNLGLYPSADDIIALGASSYQFKAGYFKKLYVDGDEIDPSNIAVDKLTATYGSNTRTLTLSATSSATTLLPSSNNTFVLGNASYKFKEIYATDYIGNWKKAENSARYMSWDSSNNVVPSTTDTISLGTSSKQYLNIYGKNLYVNGTAVVSDRRKKKDISPLDWRFEEFFKNLNPVSFKYKDGTSGRKHTGFIAQEVEEAAEKAGLTDKDIAVIVKDPEDNYYLRYEEIIAVQTKIIQELMEKTESQDAKIRDLESRLAKIEKYIFTGGETK